MNRQISLFEGEVRISLLFLTLSPTYRREDFGVLCVPAILFTEWVLPKSTHLVTGAPRTYRPKNRDKPLSHGEAHGVHDMDDTSAIQRTL